MRACVYRMMCFDCSSYFFVEIGCWRSSSSLLELVLTDQGLQILFFSVAGAVFRSGGSHQTAVLRGEKQKKKKKKARDSKARG